MRKFSMLQELRDTKEEKIEEFYVVRFSPDSRYAPHLHSSLGY